MRRRALGRWERLSPAQRAPRADLGGLLAEQPGPDAELALALQRGRLGIDRRTSTRSRYSSRISSSDRSTEYVGCSTRSPSGVSSWTSSGSLGLGGWSTGLVALDALAPTALSVTGTPRSLAAAPAGSPGSAPSCSAHGARREPVGSVHASRPVGRVCCGSQGETPDPRYRRQGSRDEPGPRICLAMSPPAVPTVGACIWRTSSSTPTSRSGWAGSGRRWSAASR